MLTEDMYREFLTNVDEDPAVVDMHVIAVHPSTTHISATSAFTIYNYSYTFLNKFLIWSFKKNIERKKGRLLLCFSNYISTVNQLIIDY